MENVVELHKADLAAGKKKLAALTPNSNEWWECKHKIQKFEIAYSQALNLAVDMFSRMFTDGKNQMSIDGWHLQFYQKLTSPYRSHKGEFRDGSKKSKEVKGMVNLDSEITDEDLNNIEH